ncbi:hypothetical protein RchiOBHm_Chr5g0023451 [Rosa chinensis]|uniref:Uncharacterized protein n=1 Tax=Rosa chinensis TaxID=74649 RepID=A0A2P6Q842_ROSCH|nr:hypothetical protein RchiOBHm_Chr5g0023451 [Rosa chinensis]
MGTHCLIIHLTCGRDTIKHWSLIIQGETAAFLSFFTHHHLIFSPWPLKCCHLNHFLILFPFSLSHTEDRKGESIRKPIIILSSLQTEE